MSQDKLLIIGLCGVARSGKDTAARFLGMDRGFERIGLADGIYAAFRDIDHSGEVTKEIEEAGLTARWAHQTLGTEAAESLTLGKAYRFLWLDYALVKIQYLAFHHPNPRLRFVVPSVRFPHQADMLRIYARERGGYCEIWKLDRPGAGLPGDAGKHRSETELEKIRPDQELHNTGTLIDLREAVDVAMDEFAAKSRAANQKPEAYAI